MFIIIFEISECDSSILWKGEAQALFNSFPNQSKVANPIRVVHFIVIFILSMSNLKKVHFSGLTKINENAESRFFFLIMNFFHENFLHFFTISWEFTDWNITLIISYYFAFIHFLLIAYNYNIGEFVSSKLSTSKSFIFRVNQFAVAIKCVIYSLSFQNISVRIN